MTASSVCPTCGQPYPGKVSGYCANDGTKLVPQLAQAASATGLMLDGRYEVRERIAEGNLGAVYRGWQHSISRDVAIKLLRPAFAADPAGSARLFTAAQLASQLSRPTIVNTYDVGYSGEALYIVSELFRGRSLAVELGSGKPLSPRRSVGIALQVCDALVGAHRIGAIHGDLKPSNILLAGEGVQGDVKITDVGFARALFPDVWQLEPKHASYVAPELADGAAPDARSDLYALGCLLHEMLTGKPPFSATTIRGMLDKHRSEPPPRLPRDTPPALVAIHAALIAKSPTERFESATAVRAALWPMRPPSSTVSLAAEPGLAPGDPRSSYERTGGHSQAPITGNARSEPPISVSIAPPPPSRGRQEDRRPVLLIALVALFVTALGIGVYYLVTQL